MNDTEKCAVCGGDDAKRYTVTSYGISHTVFVCDMCRKRVFVTTEAASKVLSSWWAAEGKELKE